MAEPRMRWHTLRRHLLKHENKSLHITDTKTDEYDLCLEVHKTGLKVQALVMEDSMTDTDILRLTKWVQGASRQSVVLLIAHGIDAASNNSSLQNLQLHLLSTEASANVLPISNVEQIVPILRLYVNHKTEIVEALHSATSTSEVLSYATTSVPRKPLSDAEVRVIRQICGSVTEFEEYTRSVEGQTELSKYLDHRVLRSMIEFWQDEWIA